MTWAHAKGAALAQVPPDKLVIGIGNYGYDWTEGKPPAQSLTFQEALMLAKDNRPEDTPEAIVDFDQKALNPTFNYEDDNEKLHEVWFLDGVTAANEWKLAQQANIRGAAVWALGMEDPSLRIGSEINATCTGIMYLAMIIKEPPMAVFR